MADWNPRANDVFLAAIEASDPAARAALLDQECADDSVLRRAVETLLRAHAAAGDFLAEPHPGAAPRPNPPTHHPGGGPGYEVVDDPDSADSTAALPPDLTRTTDGEATAYQPPEDVAGAVVAGRYKLLERIGEGGMGTVWMARQTEPVKRLVAVKLVRADKGGSKAILSRFAAERQAIALMDHPHIAKLLDAGTTDRGDPYFVMELVKGVPVTDYCDHRRLAVSDRLGLFARVCRAVQHAHQKGVIHRDLKPSNVLVEDHDGTPVPKVIDFGLAKAVGDTHLTDGTLFTGFASVLGTPLYMAPEQAAFNAADVDTRADIYALGVILYELLTGTTPIERRRLKKAALDEILRLVREEEPAAPSSRISGSAARPTIAAARRTEPARLGRFVKGELDWIVLKALSKDRDRRYETANGLAKDVDRFLNREPVAAGPPSAAYRARKFVARNKGAVAAGGVVAAALVLGMVGTTWGLVRADAARRAEADQRHDAEDARRAEAAQRAAAVDSLAEARSIAAHLNKLLGELKDRPRPGDANRDLTVRELLDGAAGDAATEFATRPRLEAAVRHTVGENYEALGLIDLAAGQYEKALRLRDAHLRPDHPDALATALRLAGCYHGAARVADAERLYRRVIGAREAALGRAHPDTLTAVAFLGTLLSDHARFDEGRKLLEEAWAGLSALPPGHPYRLNAAGMLAVHYKSTFRLDAAEVLLTDLLAVHERDRGPDHPDTLRTVMRLAEVADNRGRPDRAEPLFRRAVGGLAAALGPDHIDVVFYKYTLASHLIGRGQFAEAADLAGEVAAGSARFRMMVEEARATGTRAAALAGLGRHDEAAGELAGLAARLRAAPDPDRPEVLGALTEVAKGLFAVDRPADAAAVFEVVMAGRRRASRPDHPAVLEALHNLGTAYGAAGRHDDAARVLGEAIAGYRAAFGPADTRTALAVGSLAAAYAAAGRLDEAARLVPEFVPPLRGLAGTHLVGPLVQIGFGLVQAGRHAEAEPLLREALTIQERFAPAAWATSHTRSVLGASLLGQGKAAEAEPLLLAGYEGLKQREQAIPAGERAARLGGALDRLVELYAATNKPDEVARWWAERAQYPFVAPPPRPARK